MASLVFRRAQPPDYPAILRLQSANFIANLSEEERKEGFLSAEFSPQQVSRLAEDVGTTLATISGEVLGCLCPFRNEFDHGSRVIAKMLDTYDLVTFEGNRLDPIEVTSMARSASVAIIAVGDCCEDFTKRRSRTWPGSSTSASRLSRGAIPIL